MDKMKRTCHQ